MSPELLSLSNVAFVAVASLSWVLMYAVSRCAGIALRFAFVTSRIRGAIELKRFMLQVPRVRRALKSGAQLEPVHVLARKRAGIGRLETWLDEVVTGAQWGRRSLWTTFFNEPEVREELRRIASTELPRLSADFSILLALSGVGESMSAGFLSAVRSDGVAPSERRSLVLYVVVHGDAKSRELALFHSPAIFADEPDLIELSRIAMSNEERSAEAGAVLSAIQRHRAKAL